MEIAQSGQRAVRRSAACSKRLRPIATAGTRRQADNPRPAGNGPRAAAQFMEDYMRANPAFGANNGRHEYDGQLPDWSGHGIKRQIAWLHDERNTIAGRRSEDDWSRASNSTVNTCWR